MPSDSESDALPDIGVLLASQKPTSEPARNNLPIVDFVKNKSESHSASQRFRPSAPAPRKRPRRNPSPGLGDPGSSRPRKRRKLRDSKGNSKLKAFLPIELTSSDEEPKRPRLANAKSRANPRRTTPAEVIDLCSDAENNFIAPRSTQSRPWREEEIVILLTTDDEDSNRPVVDGDDRSPPAQREMEYSGPMSRDPPPTATPAANLHTRNLGEPPQITREGRWNTAGPLVHENPKLTHPAPSMNKETENDVSATEEPSGPLQDMYNEALREARLSEQAPITCSAFSCASGGRYDTIARHLGIFDSTSPQPPLLTPTFFMQVQRSFFSLQKARTTQVNGVCDILPIANTQLPPPCLTHPGMMPAQESLNDTPISNQSTPTRADAPRAVVRTSEDESSLPTSLLANSTPADIAVPPLIPLDSSLFPETATESTSIQLPEGQVIESSTRSATLEPTAASSVHDAVPASSVPSQIGHQIKDDASGEVESLGNQAYNRDSDSPDDLSEVLNMLLPKDVEGDEDDLRVTDEELLKLELAYP